MKFDEIRFDEHGLVPTIVQDAQTHDLLTLAYMNKESLHRTIETGETWFWSRSRAQLWHKGETSGNTQRVADVLLDCDGDALVVRVEPAGPACHTGQTSCFHNVIQAAGEGQQVAEDLGEVLSALYALVKTRQRE